MTEAKHKQRLFELVFGHMAAQTVGPTARVWGWPTHSVTASGPARNSPACEEHRNGIHR